MPQTLCRRKYKWGVKRRLFSKFNIMERQTLSSFMFWYYMEDDSGIVWNRNQTHCGKHVSTLGLRAPPLFTLHHILFYWSHNFLFLFWIEVVVHVCNKAITTSLIPSLSVFYYNYSPFSSTSPPARKWNFWLNFKLNKLFVIDRMPILTSSLLLWCYIWYCIR